MPSTPLQNGLRLLGRACAPRPVGVPDADLLDRFVRHRDEAAFELLVWRHAGMVLATCRRLLRNAHDAEDAAQACFLVLARRAGAVGHRGSVGGWLHRVACRVALRARGTRLRREARVRPLDDTPAGGPDPVAAAEGREARRVLDEEVDRLPERFRAPFVLCCLGGRANADAARELGCPVGTVESRLARARERLRTALARRGVAVPAGLFALVAQDAATASSATLAGVVVRPVIDGAASAPVLSLTHGVIQAMWLAKLKTVATLVTAAAVLGTGTTVLWHQPVAADPAARTSPTPAAKAPTEADKVADLVRRLGGSSFADREKAARELDALGAPALEALRAAARGDDPERKKRAEELVQRIEARAATAKVLAAKRVRLNYRDTPLAEAVADFKAKSGYDVVLSDRRGALKDRRVTLDTGEVTFWQAVERFCEAAGLVEARPAAAPGGWAPVGGGAGGAAGGGGGGVMPGAGGGIVGGPRAEPFAAPGRVVLADGKWAKLPTDDRTAVRVRAVRKDDAGPAADGEVLVHLEVAPEPRLRWQRPVGVDVRTATDDQGQALDPIRAADPAPAPAAGIGQRWVGAGMPESLATARTVPVRLKAGARSSAGLKELSGTVAVQVLGDPREYVAVNEIMDAAGKTVKAEDGGAVRVVGVTKEAGGKIQVRFGIDPPPGSAAGRMFHVTMRDGRVVLTGGPASAGEFEVALVDDKGATVPLTGGGIRVAGGGAEYSLVCQPAAGRGPVKLVCAVSRSVTLDVPFSLRDVPLK